MNLTLRQLKVFETAARHLSYTRAARELFLTQPAVSMQIKQLQGQLGVALFEQLGKRVYLTDAGREVLQYARTISHQLDELENVIANVKGVSGGRLRLAVVTTANYFVPSLLGTYCRRYPDVAVSLDVTNREALLRQLNENLVDLVIMGQPPAELDLDAAVFMDNPLVMVAPPDHALARKKHIPIDSLQHEVFLVREQGSGTRITMERFFHDCRIQPRIGMEVGSNEAIKQGVQAGLGLGVLSRDTLDMELSLDRLTVLDVEGLPVMRNWYLVHRRGKRLSTAAQKFKEFLLEEARAILRGRSRAGKPRGARRA